ncbi:transposase [Methylobacterium sp. PvP062]|jgi:transposase|uniref:Transposase IS4-like domain-containing protein n=2 Tax=Methylobacterium TaxID=407 RepID=A0AA37TIR3_9HYPH|nr:transposase [Methylobacterium sp. PvP105]MBP2502084.1 transposase [Methylobacterium sp. PvP109]MWV20690.1 transposase [Methylobacterium sp. 2A]PVY88583.1 DDE family transposase [Methylobacterium organophilum]RUP23034.1 MAG: hypothetical protein EKK44_01685 [Methylobacterium sp.]GJE48239.1 hypothetical protein GOFOIKOB_1266 [Methylobacterium tardum]
MPHDLPPWHAVYDQAQRWLRPGCFESLIHNLRAVLRLAAGRAEEPSAVVHDSRTPRSTPESVARAAWDGHKRTRGSKLHAAVGTLGQVLALHVTPANADDRAAVAALACAVQRATSDSVNLACVDQGSIPERAAEAAADHGITLEVVKPFAALWWPDRPVWNRDLDQVADTAWLADLAGRAGLTLDRVRAMTLDAPRRRFGRGSGDASLILSAGIYRRTRIRHALQICPRCLSAGDCAVIVETVAAWIEDWPRRFFTAAGEAGLTQRMFRKVARPGDLARQILRLPEGFRRDRTFLPVLQDKRLKRLRRIDNPRYRRIRAARILRATGPKLRRRGASPGRDRSN